MFRRGARTARQLRPAARRNDALIEGDRLLQVADLRRADPGLDARRRRRDALSLRARRRHGENRESDRRDGELGEDSWLVASALPDDVLAPAGTDLWAAVLRRQPWPLPLLSTYPLEIAAN